LLFFFFLFCFFCLFRFCVCVCHSISTGSCLFESRERTNAIWNRLVARLLRDGDKKKERKRRRRQRRQKRIECRELPALRLITAHCHRSNRDKLLNRIKKKTRERRRRRMTLRERDEKSYLFRSRIGTRWRLKHFLALRISRHVRPRNGTNNNT
jgi:hypothetical protein